MPLPSQKPHPHPHPHPLPNTPTLDQLRPIPGYGGLDLGTRRHPSHLSVLKWHGGSLFQTISKWWDRQQLIRIIANTRQIAASENVSLLLYDNTRGELQVLAERGELPGDWEGFSFTLRSKQELAAALALMLEREELKLLPDPRQKRQLTLVDQRLESQVTAEGHADCFWSLALAIKAAGHLSIIDWGSVETPDRKGWWDATEEIKKGEIRPFRGVIDPLR